MSRRWLASTSRSARRRACVGERAARRRPRYDLYSRCGCPAPASTAVNDAIARRNAVGMFSEDIDPVGGQQWGSFPQTYSMVGIITSAVRLSRPWEEIL